MYMYKRPIQTTYLLVQIWEYPLVKCFGLATRGGSRKRLSDRRQGCPEKKVFRVPLGSLEKIAFRLAAK